MTDNDLIHELKPLLFPSREIRRGELNGEIRSRVRELVAAQPQPVVPGPLPTGKLEPGVRVWKSSHTTVVATTDCAHITTWNWFSGTDTWTGRPSPPINNTPKWVECQIVAPPIKEPEPIPPKPEMRVIVLAATSMRPDNLRWWEHIADAIWMSIDGKSLHANYLEPAQLDDPEHLAGLELLKKQQEGE
jgi:hypothetical protein